MKVFLRSLAASLCGFIGMWLLQWREWLEGEPIKAGGTWSEDEEG